MPTSPSATPHTRQPRRWALWGFVAGAAITLPATVLALLLPTGETLKPYLVPGAWLLTPLTDLMATWPGLLNMTVASLVNGLVYGAVSGTVATLLGTLRHE